MFADKELSRNILALVVQGSPVLNGLPGHLDPSLFPRPEQDIARVLLKAREENGETPSLPSLRQLILDSRLKPAVRDAALQVFEDIAVRQVPDPATVVSLAARAFRLSRAAQLLEQAALRVQGADGNAPLDLGDIIAGLHDLNASQPEATPAASPRIAAPVLDRERLSEVAPFFGHVVTAFAPTTDAPYEFLVAAALVSAAGTLGKGYRLSVGTDTLYGNIWLGQIADSSLPRKTTSQGITHKLQHLTEGKWILPRAGSPEGFVQALADRDGAGVQIIGEFGAWLRAMERAYLVGHKEVLTELYDSIPRFDQQRTRKKVAGEKEKQPDVDVVTWPALTLYASTTRAWLNQNLRESDLESGFLARFLFVPVARRERPKLLATRRQPPDPEALALVVDTLKKVTPSPGPPALHSEGPPGRELMIGAEAQLVYEQWARSYDRSLPSATPFYERLETGVLKLALICAVLRGEHFRIGKRDMEAATILGDYFAQAIRYVLGEELALTRSAQAKQKILRLVEGAGTDGIRRMDLLQRGGMLKKDFDAVIDTLVEEGRIIEAKVRRGFSGRGRFGTVYRLAAPVVSTESPGEAADHGPES